MNDHGSFDGISSIDRYLSLHCYFNILRRVIPPHTGLLRLAHSCPFFQVLGKPFQGGDICKEIYSGAFLGTEKGETNSREWTGSLTWFELCIIKFIYQHKPCVAFFYKHISTISYQNTTQAFLYCNHSQFHSL
jgi:hypothetical protein